MKTKRFLALILCAVTLLTFSSCRPTGNEDGTTTADPISGTPEAPETTLPSAPTDTAEPATDTAADTSTETAADTTPSVPSVKRLSVVAVGDNLIHKGIIDDAALGGGKYDFLPKYTDIARLVADADISFINQETPMCGEKYEYTGYPRFNSPQQLGRDLVTLGFDVICFANNHMADRMKYKIGGVLQETEESVGSMTDMMNFTDTLDALVLGLYRSEKDYENIRVLEKDGVKIAFLGYTYATNVYWKTKAPRAGVYLPIIEDATVRRQIANARKLADFVVVSMHWGTEDSHTVNDEQRRLARLAADEGADVIIGTHPHVVQSVEWIEGKNGNKMLCYYSLGNSLSNQENIDNNIGYIACFDLVTYGDKKYVEAKPVVPTFNFHDKSKRNEKIWQFDHVTDDILKNHFSNCSGDKKGKITSALIKKIVTDNVPAEFLPDYLK